MTTKHTPGPWKWNPPGAEGCSSHDTEELVDSNGEPLLFSLVNGTQDRDTFLVIDTADARLIAAAPELLGACCFLLLMLSNESNCPDYGSAHNIEQTLKARRVVAKAMGEETPRTTEQLHFPPNGATPETPAFKETENG